jgi:hypothetical protein
VNGGGPDWQVRARRLAATVLIVAIAAYMAVNVLHQILPFLILSAVVIAVVAVIVAAVQTRRHRW